MTGAGFQAAAIELVVKASSGPESESDTGKLWRLVASFCASDQRYAIGLGAVPQQMDAVGGDTGVDLAYPAAVAASPKNSPRQRSQRPQIWVPPLEEPDDLVQPEPELQKLRETQEEVSALECTTELLVMDALRSSALPMQDPKKLLAKSRAEAKTRETQNTARRKAQLQRKMQSKPRVQDAATAAPAMAVSSGKNRKHRKQQLLLAKEKKAKERLDGRRSLNMIQRDVGSKDSQVPANDALPTTGVIEADPEGGRFQRTGFVRINTESAEVYRTKASCPPDRPSVVCLSVILLVRQTMGN